MNVPQKRLAVRNVAIRIEAMVEIASDNARVLLTIFSSEEAHRISRDSSTGVEESGHNVRVRLTAGEVECLVEVLGAESPAREGFLGCR